MSDFLWEGVGEEKESLCQLGTSSKVEEKQGLDINNIIKRNKTLLGN